jgi:phosphatidylinositol alpha-1,6-mannosyltransferase
MRILLLSTDFPPAQGGIQNLLAHLASGLSASNDVSVVAPAHAAAGDWDAERRFHVTRAPRARFWPLVMLGFAGAALVRAIRRPPDIVVCGHALLGPASYLIARLFGVRMVVMAYALEIRAPRMQRLARWTLRRAAMVVVISEFTRQSVIAHGVDDARIVVIHPGAAYVPDAPSFARSASFGGQAAPPVILTVARLGELYKGHDMLIRALPLVLARHPEAHYVIAGDGPLRPYLQRLAASVGVADKVTFAGAVSDEDLAQWYQRAAVFAMLSRESPSDGGAEGYGLTFIEAGAWGKPVVAGNSGGIPDAVVDGVTGLLVAPTDLAAIADALTRILADPEFAARLGAQGRDRAINELSWPNFTAAFERTLTLALDAPPLLDTVKSARS